MPALTAAEMEADSGKARIPSQPINDRLRAMVRATAAKLAYIGVLASL